jgi:hypothetical protein
MSSSLSDNVRVIPYEGSTAYYFDAYKTEADKVLAQVDGHCRRCASRITPFSCESFRMMADYNTEWRVTVENSYLCESCYKRTKEIARRSPGLHPTRHYERTEYRPIMGTGTGDVHTKQYIEVVE